MKNVLKENLDYYLEQEKIIVSRLSFLPKGSIKEKEINGDSYYYLQYRQGPKVIDDYIGKKVPKKLEESLEERKHLLAELKKVREAMKLLKKKNEPESDFIEPINRILYKFTEAGLWESGIQIIGTWCFLIYQKYLPVEKYPFQTQDIDFLIPLPYKGTPFDFSSFFRQIGFTENFNPDGSMFYSTGTMKVEFLAPQKGREERSSFYIKDLSVSPQLLRFVDILLKETITIKVSRNVKVKLPSPCTFFLHKLLISTRSKRIDKKEKDLKQAIYIGKYILLNDEEKEKLLSQWADFSKSWKNRVKMALEEAYKAVPVEKNIILQLKKVLYPTNSPK